MDFHWVQILGKVNEMCFTVNGQGVSNKLDYLSMLAGANSSDIIICRLPRLYQNIG